MKRFWGVFVFLTLVLIFSGCSSSPVVTNSIGKSESQKEVVKLFDTSEFSRISTSELEKKMGKPESVENWTFNDKYETTTYTYDSGNVEFMIIDDSVVRFSYYPVELIAQDKMDLFPMFGIEPGENMSKVSDTGTALKYHTVSDKIAEFYALTDLGDDTKITDIKVTYDLRYFE